MARPPVLAAWLVLAQLGVATAGSRTSKVTIETDPPGAKVYFGLKEDGEICTTPCTIDAPVGETAMIIEAENRRSIIENLVVRRSGRPVKLHFTLEPALGTLIIEGGDGATIKLDEQDEGTAPRRIDNVLAGAHHVALVKNGKQIFDDFVDIQDGQEATISVPEVTAAPDPLPDDAAAVSARASSTSGARKRQSPMFAVAAVMNVGFRQFTYTENKTPMTQLDDRERGQVLTGAIVDVWPTTLLGSNVFPGLALHGRFEYGVNPRPVTRKRSPTQMAESTSLKTAWQSLEISLNHRWTIRNTGTIEVGGGYVNDRHRFTGNPGDLMLVPDASYQAVRIGARGSLLLRSFEPYIALDNRIVLSGGPMEERYSLGTSVSGFRGVLGGALHVRQFQFRLEGAVTLYRWAFNFDNDDMWQAGGGSDVIENVTFAIGYTY